jgi:formylglycine-generating enzyme required for sulfatase activity
MSHREALIERVLGRGDSDDDATHARVLADLALEAGDQPLLAAALDRAFGLAPHDEAVQRLRQEVLGGLTLYEHGLVFRYVPGGTFLMGSADGDVDERPVHPQRVSAFWMTDVPISWADHCRLMGWEAPPSGAPPRDEQGEWLFSPEHQENRIRLQYCETGTDEAQDWHAHAVGLESFFGRAPSRSLEPHYSSKPMVAVSWTTAAALGARLSTEAVQYGLPTEAEWERAARGGRIGARYAWGHEAPDPTRCDCAQFGRFALLPSRALPPNDFGLFAMCGGVSEWTFDRYDALAYHPRRPEPAFPADAPRVLRGGSFTDDEEAVTVSFRMATTSDRASGSPTVGFRLVRRAPPDPLLAWAPPPRTEGVVRRPPAPVAEPAPAAPPVAKTWWQRLLGR